MDNFLWNDWPNCQVDSIEQTGDKIEIKLHTKTKNGLCPRCGERSECVHSYQRRRVQDLPLGGKVVYLQLTTKRFRCLNVKCDKQTFFEALTGIIRKHARYTIRLETALYHIGQTGGGQAGSRLTQQLSMPASRCTLLRILRRQPLPLSQSPVVVGVDDWAKRKGQIYGTILVDLEQHRVLDVLPDREVETVSAWLKTQPHIRIVARDRSPQYAQAITQGAPQAVQVADRWHLLKNLSEVVERCLPGLFTKLKQQFDLVNHEPAARPKFPRAKADEAQQHARREQRLKEYTQVRYLHLRGYSQRQIARTLGLSREKVRRFSEAPHFPERRPRHVPSTLDPFLPYLEQQVATGILNAQQLWREVHAQGYPGTSAQVEKWVAVQRRQQPATPQPAIAPLTLPDLRLAHHVLTANPNRLSSKESVLLTFICQVEPIHQLYKLVQSFALMLKEHRADTLDNWLTSCASLKLSSLTYFAASLRADYAAIRAALEQRWSNGQTEGQVHRLKMLKRQMYGRANLDLLRIRLLYPYYHRTT